MPPTAKELHTAAANNPYLAITPHFPPEEHNRGTSIVPPDKDLPTEALLLKAATMEPIPVLVHGLTTKTTSKPKSTTRKDRRVKKQKAADKQPRNNKLPGEHHTTHRNYGQTDRSHFQRPHNRK